METFRSSRYFINLKPKKKGFIREMNVNYFNTLNVQIVMFIYV